MHQQQFMNRKHFQTFDAFRFFSFLLVFLQHLPNASNTFIGYFQRSGGIGVLFFFVLSGFLISYILFFEKAQKGSISLKNFYLRRMLRIWPLFYLMIAFAYLSPVILHYLNLPSEKIGYEPDLLVSLMFAENYQMMLTDSFPNGAPLRVMWTLCVEEHFYILWGICIYFISIQKVPFFIFFTILVANISRVIYRHFDLAPLDILSHLDYFAFGTAVAYIYMFRKNILEYIGSISLNIKRIFVVLSICFVFLIPSINWPWFKLLSPTILGLLFAFNILFTLHRNAIHIDDNHLFSRLGIYTYGLYLYHTIIILLCSQVFKTFGIGNWYSLSLLSLFITIAVSVLSYHLFEKQFLKLKKRLY